MSTEAGQPELSIVVPCYNEEENLEPLVVAIRQTLDSRGLDYEIIITDDRSTDRSWEILSRLAAEDPRIRGQRLKKNSGESAASWAGMRAARGTYIATLDADLQNDPAELPAFLEAVKKTDCVCGSRVETRREGDNWIRVWSSLTANAVRNKLSGENISDAGCTYRVFRRECVSNLKFFKGMHRFLPTLIKMEGYQVAELSIKNQPRLAGTSKYGVWNRVFSSFADLLAVRWMKKRMFPVQVAEQTPGKPADSKP